MSQNDEARPEQGQSNDSRELRPPVAPQSRVSGPAPGHSTERDVSGLPYDQAPIAQDVRIRDEWATQAVSDSFIDWNAVEEQARSPRADSEGIPSRPVYDVVAHQARISAGEFGRPLTDDLGIVGLRQPTSSGVMLGGLVHPHHNQLHGGQTLGGAAAGAREAGPWLPPSRRAMVQGHQSDSSASGGVPRHLAACDVGSLTNMMRGKANSPHSQPASNTVRETGANTATPGVKTAGPIPTITVTYPESATAAAGTVSREIISNLPARNKKGANSRSVGNVMPPGEIGRRWGSESVWRLPTDSNPAWAVDNPPGWDQRPSPLAERLANNRPPARTSDSTRPMQPSSHAASSDHRMSEQPGPGDELRAGANFRPGPPVAEQGQVPQAPQAQQQQPAPPPAFGGFPENVDRDYLLNLPGQNTIPHVRYPYPRYPKLLPTPPNHVPDQHEIAPLPTAVEIQIQRQTLHQYQVQHNNQHQDQNLHQHQDTMQPSQDPHLLRPRLSLPPAPAVHPRAPQASPSQARPQRQPSQGQNRQSPTPGLDALVMAIDQNQRLNAANTVRPRQASWQRPGTRLLNSFRQPAAATGLTNYTQPRQSLQPPPQPNRTLIPELETVRAFHAHQRRIGQPIIPRVPRSQEEYEARQREIRDAIREWRRSEHREARAALKARGRSPHPSAAPPPSTTTGGFVQATSLPTPSGNQLPTTAAQPLPDLEPRTQSNAPAEDVETQLQRIQEVQGENRRVTRAQLAQEVSLLKDTSDSANPASYAPQMQNEDHFSQLFVSHPLHENELQPSLETEYQADQGCELPQEDQQDHEQHFSTRGFLHETNSRHTSRAPSAAPSVNVNADAYPELHEFW